MHNNPLQSNFIVEVDEFKFSKIVSSVIQKASQPLKETKEVRKDDAAFCDDNNNDGDDDSCSLSDYDDETELSNDGADHHT